jgi:hypothetical protein
MSDRRELLEKAWSDVEEKEEKSAVEEVSQKAAEDTNTSGSEEQIQESGKEEIQQEERSEKPVKEEKDPYKVEKEAAQKQPKEQKTEQSSQPVTDKAPQSWKPAIREHWAKLPAEVRAEISRRELEVQQALSRSDQARKFSDQFIQTINPFAHLIRAQNSTPLRAVHNLMTTAAGLMTGNMEQKAKIVAEIINNYGVDIKTLDSVLSNAPIPQNQGHAAVPQQFAQMLQPVYSFIDEVQQMRQAQQQKLQEQADAEVAQVQGEPFFDDLRDDIADIMEIAANRGRKMTIKEAYDKAVELNPEISKIIKQRKEAEAARAGMVVVDRARKAASTISGAPAGGRVAGKGAPKNRREALEQAWEDNSR